MKPNKNYNFYDNEISLKEVFGQTLKSWKKWLAVGVVFAIALGMYKTIPSLKTYNNLDNRTAYVSENKEKVKYLQKDIDEMQYQIDKQEEYYSNSIYININPLQEQKGVISYYVSTNQTGSEFDYSKDVVHAYKNLFDSGKVAEYVKKNLSYSIEEEYIYELMSANTDESSKTDNYLDVTIVHSDEKKLNEIMGLVQKYIEENQGLVSTQVGMHKLSLVSNSTALVTDSDITTKRTELDSAKTALQTSLTAKRSELASTQGSNLSLSTIVKSTIKYILVGLVAGIFVCAIGIATYIILSNKIISANQIRTSIGIPVLGDFVKQKKLSKLAKLGYKLVGEVIDVDFDDTLEVAAYNMVSLTEKKDIVMLDLVEDDLSSDVLEKITQYDFINDIKVIKGCKTLEKFDMLEKLNNTTGVVIVGKKLDTKISRLEREISIATNYCSEIVGILLV